MMMWKFFQIALLGGAALVFVTMTSADLPEFPAAHFGADGTPNAFMTRRGYVAFMYFFVAVVPLFVSLLPVVGPALALLGGGYLAARFAAYDSLDATLSRWGWSYTRKQELLRRRRALCMGLGAFVAALLAVPVVNALALSVGAAGGASLALEGVPEAERAASTAAAR